MKKILVLMLIIILAVSATVYAIPIGTDVPSHCPRCGTGLQFVGSLEIRGEKPLDQEVCSEGKGYDYKYLITEESHYSCGSCSYRAVGTNYRTEWICEHNPLK